MKEREKDCGVVIFVHIHVVACGWDPSYVASAKRLDYVDFFKERKKEMKLVNAATTRLMNATTTKTHPPPSSREGGFTKVWYELLEKKFFDKEDPKKARLYLIYYFGFSFLESLNNKWRIGG